MKKEITVSLGALQAELELATKTLRAAQRAKLKADEAFERATEAHERSRITLNAAVGAVKSSTHVGNLYAN